jgi:hypothetical protein
VQHFSQSPIFANCRQIKKETWKGIRVLDSKVQIGYYDLKNLLLLCSCCAIYMELGLLDGGE